MPKLKHSKFKNTYLIYEFLVRQMTSEILEGNKPNKSQAFAIIKKYFSTGILKEELEIYNALVNNSLTKKFTAEYLINECIARYQKMNHKDIATQRYNLIGEIKKHYNIDMLFSKSIKEYNEAGAVYLMLESARKDYFIEKSTHMGTVLENIMKPVERTKTEKIFECIEKAKPEDRAIAFEIIVNTFNKKFDNVLSENQKRFLSDFVYSNEENWIHDHLNLIKKRLSSKIKKLSSSSNTNDKVMSLKLKECVNKFEYIRKKKILDESDYTKVMLGYHLIKQADEL